MKSFHISKIRKAIEEHTYDLALDSIFSLFLRKEKKSSWSVIDICADSQMTKVSSGCVDDGNFLNGEGEKKIFPRQKFSQCFHFALFAFLSSPTLFKYQLANVNRHARNHITNENSHARTAVNEQKPKEMILEGINDIYKKA
jgi:hypothetical protein